MNKKTDAYSNPVWNMYECEKGNRFTFVKGGGSDHVDLTTCNFSGCTHGDHGTRIAGETNDRAVASAWARR